MCTAGIVLCGGRSVRMGRAKAALPFAGEVMLVRVVRVLRAVVEPVIVVAAPGQDVPLLPTGVEVVRDEVEGRGPLGGIAAGLAAIGGTADAAYASSCDVPLLTPEFVRRVVELLDGSSPHLAAVPRVNDWLHPLAAAYRVAVLPVVREMLAAGRLRTIDLFDAVPTRVIESAELADIDPEFRSLSNLNTPDEYEAALQAFARSAVDRPQHP
jgi:molybdopterin-guanine dinucleotide biosynthesis protein A